MLVSSPSQSAKMKHQNHNMYVLTLLPEQIYTKGSLSFDNITGPNGHRPVDFAIDLLQTAKTVGVTEVNILRVLPRMLYNLNLLYRTVNVRQVRWRRKECLRVRLL